jgi:hypothetical protein
MTTTSAQPLHPAKIDCIDSATYQAYRHDLDLFETWRDGRTSYHPDEVPNHLQHVNNDMRGLVEQYEFKHNPPEKYFTYWSKRQVSTDGAYQNWLVTWNGEPLAKVSGCSEWRDNFGGTRVSFQALGINGLWYSGTYFKSSGDYCRIKLLKRNPNNGKIQTIAKST